MSTYYVGIPLLILVAVFDTTLMTLLWLWGGGPNLMLMVIVSWALLVDLREALPWAILGGVFRDLLSEIPTGSSSLFFVILVIVIDLYLPKLNWRSLLIPILTIGAATVAYMLYIFAILVIIGWPVPKFAVLTYVILPSTIENMLLVLIVFRTIGAVLAFLRPSRPSLID
ncbi:MAG: rod shape-determining protein MreD [Phototrophicales bacterium]|nr:MAG: rod shape-determining protein MreD [Phototrophicales bacterium]